MTPGAHSNDESKARICSQPEAPVPTDRFSTSGLGELKPASQLAMESLVWRNQFAWAYIFVFDLVTRIVAPEVNHFIEWHIFFVLDVLFCATRFCLLRRMSRSAEIQTRLLRIFTVIVPLHALSMGIAVSFLYLRLGLHSLTLTASIALALYASGALRLHRSNLRLLREVGVAFLLLPGLTALWIGGPIGIALGLILLGEMVYCFLQAHVENTEYWAGLHATRDLMIARRRSEAAAQLQLELTAERTREGAIAAERARMAGEWHDTLLSGFSAIGWHLEMAGERLAEEPEEAAKSLHVARNLLHHYRAEVRFVVADLQAGESKSDDLAQTIAQAVEPLFRGRDVRLRIESAGAKPVLSHQTRRQLTRICQEAAANALRHASPTTVAIAIGATETDVVIRIEDDGAGFETGKSHPGHFGLMIMKDRAARAGGKLEIVSRPGAGTKITVKVSTMNPHDGNQTRILIVEDQYFSRLAIQTLLETRDNIRIVGEAQTGKEALELYRKLRPDVTIMDMRLPDTMGFDLIRNFRAEDPLARILVLSNLDGADHIHRAAEAGASGYVTKDSAGAELWAALDAVLQGKTYLPAPVSQRLGGRHPSDELTGRERDVMEQLVVGQSNRDIAMRLGIAEKTVRVHLTSIFAKLGVQDRTQAVIVALERGAVDPPVRLHQNHHHSSLSS